MTDLYLAKVQAFTTNNCFERSNYLMKLYNTKTMNCEKKTSGLIENSMPRRLLWNIWGGVKHQSLKTRDINIIDSSVYVLWKSKWICFYCQIFSISYLIQRVAGSLVGGSAGKWLVVGWSVGCWSVDSIRPRKKHV